MVRLGKCVSISAGNELSRSVVTPSHIWEEREIKKKLEDETNRSFMNFFFKVSVWLCSKNVFIASSTSIPDDFDVQLKLPMVSERNDALKHV